MATFLSVLKVAPELVSLLLAIWRYMMAAKDRKIGHDEAALEAISAAINAIEQAAQVRSDAAQEHAAHPTDDGGFDSEFKRPD